MLFSFVFLSLSKNVLGKVLLAAFLTILTVQNLLSFRENYGTSLDDPEIIAFSNQLKAVEWIRTDASDTAFNVDVYVPPVIPYAYDYLFKWRKLNPVQDRVPLLYTLYEVDPEHPERLDAWLKRQKGIGKVLKEVTFGGIIIQERERI